MYNDSDQLSDELNNEEKVESRTFQITISDRPKQ